MKIVKYKKCRNKYNVYFDDGNYIGLYEDIILKYSLLLKKEITDKDLESIKLDNTKEEIYNKLDRLIDKKIKTTKNCSGNILKQKVINYFINEGYNYSDIEKVIDNKDLNVGDAKKEYEKLYNRYSKKYSGYELDMIIKQKLYQKGYNYDKIN